ncbi:MAG: hypothetical protein JKX73_04950, partial [Flavobacteriales bacterium]|nr:hypothetical protein [Flavobacteriales bacterium]
MIKLIKLIPILLLFGTLNTRAQELTPDEQAFKDSIEALNLDFATVQKSKEAYNQGISQ